MGEQLTIETDNAKRADESDESQAALRGAVDEDERAIIAEFGVDEKDHWQCKIYRQGDKLGERGWIFDRLPSQFPVLDELREVAGPGLYHGYVYKNKKLYKILKWHIAKLRDGARVNDPLAAIVTQQGEMMRDLVAQVAQLKSAPAPLVSASDPVAMMKAMCETMMSLKALAPAQPRGSGDMAMFIKGVELAQKMHTDDREKGIMDILSDVLTKTPIMDNLAAAVAPKQANAQAPAQLTGAPAAMTAEQVQAAQLQQVTQVLGYLVTRAQKNAPPDLYADWILDNLPSHLLPMLEQPGALELLGGLHPPVLTYRSWFEALLMELTQGEPPEEPGEDVPRPRSPAVASNFNPRWAAGSQSDIEGNGEAGETGTH